MVLPSRHGKTDTTGRLRSRPTKKLLQQLTAVIELKTFCHFSSAAPLFDTVLCDRVIAFAKCERSGRWWAHDKCTLLLLLVLLKAAPSSRICSPFSLAPAHWRREREGLTQTAYYYNNNRELTLRRRRVSILVFYAQSISTVISGRERREWERLGDWEGAQPKRKSAKKNLEQAVGLLWSATKSQQSLKTDGASKQTKSNKQVTKYEIFSCGIRRIRLRPQYVTGRAVPPAASSLGCFMKITRSKSLIVKIYLTWFETEDTNSSRWSSLKLKNRNKKRELYVVKESVVTPSRRVTSAIFQSVWVTPSKPIDYPYCDSRGRSAVPTEERGEQGGGGKAGHSLLTEAAVPRAWGDRSSQRQGENLCFGQFRSLSVSVRHS